MGLWVHELIGEYQTQGRGGVQEWIIATRQELDVVVRGEHLGVPLLSAQKHCLEGFGRAAAIAKDVKDHAPLIHVRAADVHICPVVRGVVQDDSDGLRGRGDTDISSAVEIFELRRESFCVVPIRMKDENVHRFTGCAHGFLLLCTSQR